MIWQGCSTCGAARYRGQAILQGNSGQGDIVVMVPSKLRLTLAALVLSGASFVGGGAFAAPDPVKNTAKAQDSVAPAGDTQTIDAVSAQKRSAGGRGRGASRATRGRAPTARGRPPGGRPPGYRPPGGRPPQAGRPPGGYPPHAGRPPGYRPGYPGYRPGYRPIYPGYPGYRPPAYVWRPWGWQGAYWGSVVAGVTLGAAIAVAANAPPAPPSPDLCWTWLNDQHTQGYWYYCSGP